MSTDAFRYKKPFTPDLEVTEQLTAWETLDLSGETEPAPGETNALNLRRPPRAHEQPVAEPAEPEFKPLTAEEMELLRQAAYEEGFAEGKEEGFSKGYHEGREQGLQDGTTQGIAEGRKQGLQEAQPEIDARLQQLALLLDQLQQPLKGLDQQVQQALCDLTLAMSKAVIAVEVKTNPQVILQALQEATAALPLNAEHLIIKIHPDDMETIRQHYSDVELQERGWQLRAEPLLEQGGCLVESEKSSVDRSLTQRLQSSLEHFLHKSATE